MDRHPEKNTRPANPTRGRRLLFCALSILAALAIIELGSVLLLGFLPGTDETPEADDGAAETPTVGRGEAAPGRGLARRIQTEQALHPYLGYVADAERHPQVQKAAAHPEAIEWGFPWSREKLFHEPSDERLVIAVFGGSVASIFANHALPILSRELQQAERFAGREVVIVNLSLGGYKQPQQLMTLAYHLALGAHFDLAVNLDGFNDVALAPPDNVRKGVAAFYPRNWYFRVEKLDQKIRTAAGELTYLRARRAERREALEGSLWRHSPTARLLWRLGDSRLEAHVASRQLELLESEPEIPVSYQAQGPDRAYASTEELYRDLAQIWARGSLAMHHLCRGLGIEYYHFLQPNQYDAGSKPLSAEERRDAFDPKHPYREGVIKGYPLLKELGARLRREGVEFHDLSRVFAGVDATFYNDTCCHFNWRGNHHLARRVAEILTRQ